MYTVKIHWLCQMHLTNILLVKTTKIWLKCYKYLIYCFFFCSFSVKKPDINEVVNKTSVYNKTVYVGNLPEQISGKY